MIFSSFSGAVLGPRARGGRLFLVEHPPAVPVLPEQVDGQLLHGDPIVGAELIDRLGDADVRVVIDGSGHVCPEGVLEIGHQVTGDGPLGLGSEVIAEDGVLPDRAVQVMAPGSRVRIEEGDADAVIRNGRSRGGSVVLRRQLEMHGDEPPEMGAPLRVDGVPGVDGDEVLPQCRMHLHEYCHVFMLLSSSHAAKVKGFLFLP